MARPAAMASAAWAAITSQVAPPTAVESTQVGRSPRYSATSTGARVPSPAEAKPSTTERSRPESASARRAAWACRAYGVESSTRPQSASATPTTATLRGRREAAGAGEAGPDEDEDEKAEGAGSGEAGAGAMNLTVHQVVVVAATVRA